MWGLLFPIRWNTVYTQKRKTAQLPSLCTRTFKTAAAYIKPPSPNNKNAEPTFELLIFPSTSKAHIRKELCHGLNQKRAFTFPHFFCLSKKGSQQYFCERALSNVMFCKSDTFHDWLRRWVTLEIRGLGVPIVAVRKMVLMLGEELKNSSAQ